MSVRLLPWQPEYGTSMQFDAESDEAAAGPPNVTVERRVWQPVTPAPASLPAVQVVDGVRRAEAHAMDDAPDGTPIFGLFGSFGVGAVRCGPFDGARGPAARILDDDPHQRIERRYFHTGEAADLIDAVPAPDVVIDAGRTRLVFKAEPVRRASTANALVARLNQAMLDAEAKLAEELSRDESALTLVDGPLRSLRSPGRRVVGYIKRIQQWYIGREELGLLPTLRAGERTPVFHIPPADTGGLGAGAASDGRYSWFLRLADLGVHVHPLGGVMRLETSGTLPLADAVRLADETAALMPRLASSPARDPRAPQNLTPVAALEARLTHLLGDRLFIRRLITAAVARPVRREVFG
jgi:hypothetical protein